jgi:hypothetical protein
MLADAGTRWFATMNSETQPSGHVVCNADSPSEMSTSKVQSASTCSVNGSGGGRSPSK